MKRYTHTHSKLNNRVTIREMSTVNHLKNLREEVPNDKYSRGQTVHQQRYMFGD